MQQCNRTRGWSVCGCSIQGSLGGLPFRETSSKMGFNAETNPKGADLGSSGNGFGIKPLLRRLACVSSRNSRDALGCAAWMLDSSLLHASQLLVLTCVLRLCTLRTIKHAIICSSMHVERVCRSVLAEAACYMFDCSFTHMCRQRTPPAPAKAVLNKAQLAAEIPPPSQDCCKKPQRNIASPAGHLRPPCGPACCIHCWIQF